MSETQNWFNNNKGGNSNNGDSKTQPKFVYLKKGEKTKLTFLDPDPTEDSQNLPDTVDVITVYGFGSDKETFPTFVLDPASLKLPSPIAEYRDSLDPESKLAKSLVTKTYYVQSVLQHDVDSEGKPYKPSKRIRLLTEGQMKYGVLPYQKELAEATEGPIHLAGCHGLCGHTFSVARGTDQTAAKVGEIGTYLSTPVLNEIHESPEPFTQEELLEIFVTDTEAMQAYVDRMSGDYQPPKPE